MAGITGDWLAALKPEFSKDYYKNLYEFVKAEYASRTIYPKADDIFNALHLTTLEKVKVVILGQDPYHGDNQAHGLAFSVLPNVEIPPSLQNKGWERFTDAIIEAVNKSPQPVVFMLWGRPAQLKAAMLDNPKHLVLKAPHPSPLSAYRGFFGCKHFSKANDFLKSNGLEPIDWQIENI